MDSGYGRRRSQRVDLRVLVRFSLDGRHVDTETVLVSRHGALVRCPWPDDETEGFKLGIDIVENGTSFWGPDYEGLVSLIGD